MESGKIVANPIREENMSGASIFEDQLADLYLFFVDAETHNKRVTYDDITAVFTTIKRWYNEGVRASPHD